MKHGRRRLVLFTAACTVYLFAAGYLGYSLAVKAAGPGVPGIGLPYHENQESGLLVGSLAFPMLGILLLLFLKRFRSWTGRNPLPIIGVVFGLLCIPYYFVLFWQFG
jgi:hypothetical protein